MKLLYTSNRNIDIPKNKLYFKNYFFNKTNKNLLKKRFLLKTIELQLKFSQIHLLC